MCSCCGNIKETLLLSERVYNCSNCGLVIDRDVNAAINIKQIGLKMPEFMPVEEVGYEADEAGSEHIN
jgi:transposase